MSGNDAVAVVTDLSHLYGSVAALDRVSISFPASRLIGLIGPDGVGKSSLLAILAGARQIQQGKVQVLGVDISDTAARTAVCPRIAYMPQGLGKNLYPTLSVEENLQFFGRLFGHDEDERRRRIDALTRATGMNAFLARPAGKLFIDARGAYSGGQASNTDGKFEVRSLYRLQNEGHGCDDPNFRQTIVQAGGNEPGWSVMINAQGLLPAKPTAPVTTAAQADADIATEAPSAITQPEASTTDESTES